MSLSELKPCPFCGGEAEINQIGNEATRKRGYEVRCLTWGCSTAKRAMVIRQPLSKAREFAVERWNARPALLDAARAEQKEDGEPVAWSLVFNEKRGVNPDTTFLTKAKAEKYAEGCSFPRPRVVPLYAHPPRAEQPVMSREAVEKVLADYFGLRPYAEMAADRSDLRGKIRDGYDVNEPTKCDLAEAADAILALASLGGRGGDALDLKSLDAWFTAMPEGPFDALHTTAGWEIRQIDTDPGNRHHWPFRLCESIQGQTAGCDEAVFSFIAGVINAWPSIRARLETPAHD